MISVVGFHTFPKLIQGGFIGVDIFFVISGFLISTIIFGNLELNSFSFVDFYSRRIKRIFPALFLILIFSYTLGWIVLFDDEYKQLGQHIASGSIFISNFILWNESGYFDNAVETKPLVHLWSLGIEEQFYIIWPLLLWLTWKSRLNMFVITISVAFISFLFNIYEVYSDTISAFYLPQTRFWELLIGAVGAWIFLNKQKINSYLSSSRYSQLLRENIALIQNTLSIIGALTIAISLFIIKKELLFPGWWALLPTLGTLLIILAGSTAWLNRNILSHPVLMWFGLISFPLYLWHWPLLSFIRIITGEFPSAKISLAVILISIIFAWLTYKLIEKPIRFGNYTKRKTAILLVLISTIGLLGFNSFQRNGLPFRKVINLSKDSGYDGGDGGKSIYGCGISDEKDNKLFNSCKQDSRQTPKYALLGDSKADAIYAGLLRTSHENGRWLFIGGTGKKGALVPVLSNNELYKKYRKFSLIAFKAVSENKNIEKVILVTAIRSLFQLNSDSSIEELPNSKMFNSALEGLSNSINTLTDAGKKVVIVVDNPSLLDPKNCIQRITNSNLINRFVPKKINSGCSLKLNRHLELSKQYRLLLTQIAEKYPNKVKIFDTTKYMCNIEKDICMAQKNGRFLYSYSDHISDYAAGMIGVDLNNFLQTF